MDLTSPKTIKELLKGRRPSKRLGQNFLIDKNILWKIVESSDVSNEKVLEIGPGLGALTSELSKKAKGVVAVEKDPLMCKILRESLSKKNVKIIKGDILKKDLWQFTGFKVVANLPYYIVSPTIRKLLEESSIKKMYLMVQKEVAERITANPPKMNLLAISVQFYGSPEILFKVSKNSFWPKPKVDSSFLKIRPHSKHKTNKDLFFKVVKLGFSHPRKQLLNNLSKEVDKNKIKEILLKEGLNPKARAETLNVEDWVKLAKSLATFF